MAVLQQQVQQVVVQLEVLEVLEGLHKQAPTEATLLKQEGGGHLLVYRVMEIIPREQQREEMVLVVPLEEL